jgi:hypothetical protein
MNGNTSAPYNSSLSLVKALDVNSDKVVIGYYKANYKHFIFDIFADVPHDVQINPYTVCRNSGIKDKKGSFVFEYDLLRLTHGMKSPCYGFLVWDEFYKSWKIRRRTDRTAYNNLDEWTIESIGNIILSDADAEIIYNQEKEEDAKKTFIDGSYCPSKFRR